MPDDTTLLLRRAVTQRHTPHARGFFAALVEALAAGTDDLDEVCRIVARGCVPGRLAASSVSEWLQQLIAGSPLDARLVLAGADDVEAALRRVRPQSTPNADRSRMRVRAAMGAAIS